MRCKGQATYYYMLLQDLTTQHSATKRHRCRWPCPDLYLGHGDRYAAQCVHGGIGGVRGHQRNCRDNLYRHRNRTGWLHGQPGCLRGDGAGWRLHDHQHPQSQPCGDPHALRMGDGLAYRTVRVCRLRGVAQAGELGTAASVCFRRFPASRQQPYPHGIDKHHTDISCGFSVYDMAASMPQQAKAGW